MLSDCEEGAVEVFEERAAIQEHDGGLTQAVAEAEAYKSSQQFRMECEARHWVAHCWPSAKAMAKQLDELQVKRGDIEPLRAACRVEWTKRKEARA